LTLQQHKQYLWDNFRKAETSKQRTNFRQNIRKWCQHSSKQYFLSFLQSVCSRLKISSNDNWKTMTYIKHHPGQIALILLNAGSDL